MVTKLTDQFIQNQQQRLQEEKKKSLQRIEALKKDDPFSDPDYAADNAAVDTDVREQLAHQTLEAEIKDLKKRIVDTDAALVKITKNRYGYCEKCGSLIPIARLELIPESRYCVTCEGKLRQ
jgi:DnaK suppressor protein